MKLYARSMLGLLYFYIGIQTWKIVVNCEETETEVAISLPGFTDDTGDTNFVDPYSFDYDRATKKMAVQRTAELLPNKGVCISDSRCQEELKECQDLLNNIEPDGPFSRRLINLLLANVKFKEDGDFLSGSISFSGTKEQIDKLKEYGNGNGKCSMRQVDAILTHVIITPKDIFTEVLTWMDHLRIFIHQYGRICTTVFATIAILLSIKFVNWSTGKVVIIFLAIVFFTSYFLIWSQLMKEAEIKRFAAAKKYKEPPIQCEPEKMYFWERIITYFDGADQCFEYYKAMELDVFHEVTPLDALVVVFDRLLLYPAVRFGTGISHFIENSTQHLGFPMKWIISILLYLGVVVFIVVLPFSLFGGAFSFWFGPFFRMSIGKGQTNRNQQNQRSITERREPIKVILQVNSNSVHTVEDNQLTIGDGNFRSEKQIVKKDNSNSTCKNCCCKETSSSNNSHVQEDAGLVNESTISDIQRTEKGDGDC